MLPSLWVVPATPNISPDAMPLHDVPPKIVAALVCTCLPPTVRTRDGHVPLRLVITALNVDVAVGEADVSEVASTLPSLCFVPYPPRMSPAAMVLQVFPPKFVAPLVATTVPLTVSTRDGQTPLTLATAPLKLTITGDVEAAAVSTCVARMLPSACFVPATPMLSPFAIWPHDFPLNFDELFVRTAVPLTENAIDGHVPDKLDTLPITVAVAAV